MISIVISMPHKERWRTRPLEAIAQKLVDTDVHNGSPKATGCGKHQNLSLTVDMTH